MNCLNGTPCFSLQCMLCELMTIMSLRPLLSKPNLNIPKNLMHNIYVQIESQNKVGEIQVTRKWLTE